MDESPFGPIENNKRRELKFYEKLYVKSVDKFNEFYIDSIPSDDVKAMPPRFMYPIGGFILTILLCIFVAIFLPSYLQAIHQKYLAPGSQSSRYCSEVTISNSGSYLATQTGYWSGGSEFQYSLSAYNLDVQNLDVSTEDFALFMNEIYELLADDGPILATQDLGVNLMYWMSYTLVSSLSAAQRFYLMGNPVIVFTRTTTVGSLSNEYADCDLEAYTSFDQANGVMTVSYNYDEFTSNPTCNTTLSPLLFGYTTLGNDEDLTLSLDVRALVTAFSVNYGILQLIDLQEIVATRSVFIYEDQPYNASTYVNPNFPGMPPIFCVNFEDIEHCVITIGASFGLPFFNHMGSNYTFPMPCNCSALTEEELSDKYNTCNMFTFISGVLVYNNISSYPLFEMATKFSGYEGVFMANEYSYYSSFVGSTWGKNSPYYDSLFNLPETREELYDFCYLPGWGGCTMIIFSSFDLYNENWAISDYYFSVPNGACRDTVTPSYENWQKLIETPYAPLTQGYSECRNSPTTVFFNQVGVAVGNVSLLTPFGVLFVLILIGVYQNLTGKAIPKTYSRAEKDSALDALAVALLLARDEKRKQKINPDHQVLTNMITKLVDDLSEIAESSNGTYYKREEVDKFEVDWKAVVKAPFSRQSSRSLSTSITTATTDDNKNALELSNLEAQSPGPAGKIVFQRTKVASPSATVQSRFPDLLILNIASVGYKGSTSLVTLRLSDMSSNGKEKLSSADVRSQLKDLKNDTNSDVLYSQTITALDSLIEYFKETYRQTPKRKAVDVENGSGKVTIAPEHVVLSDRASVLNSIEALTRFQEIVTLNEADKDEDDEEVDDSSTSTVYLNRYIVSIYKKIYALMLLHVGILVQSDGVGMVHNAYCERVAYYVNNEVFTMSELKVKANV